ncbi:hypothetical protein CWS02_12250 [Enterobacter sp. EA-1]|nr:hypothetical protein CWS02_12250 [Enterobacter sp. EA-1]
MNTSDMHPFIHPLSAAVDPAWESKSDWEIYKGSQNPSLSSVSVTLVKKPMWSRCLSSTTRLPNWRNRWA